MIQKVFIINSSRDILHEDKSCDILQAMAPTAIYYVYVLLYRNLVYENLYQGYLYHPYPYE